MNTRTHSIDPCYTTFRCSTACLQLCFREKWEGSVLFNNGLN